MISLILSRIYQILLSSNNTRKNKKYRKEFKIHPTVRLNYPENIWFKGNIIIGAYT